ncbi:EGF-containing fibulin-like extracellular matrix protein 2 [Galendromus occidentalis]|uniref:EGF-containing fibulin-like extracellular matrix protein 2 n=1 Tax=Galendromus occidentalis TaxID=34638 RepID=A0AAJ6QWR9_9ACAR|nr:EGF-containing fibulin-like extracellular matrix protein 2 [Galendromus occidentalis]
MILSCDTEMSTLTLTALVCAILHSAMGSELVSRDQVMDLMRNLGPLRVDLPHGKLIFAGNPKCADGLEFDPRTGFCVDINECARGTHNCSHAALCVNHAGTFECADPGRRPLKCAIGYKYNWHLDECLEIDECYSNPCEREFVCINQLGGFHCMSRNDPSCPTGYQFRPGRGCLDIDECRKSHHCENNEQCVNLQGSYMCVHPCPKGFLMIPFQWECIDVDECQDETDDCAPEGEECINTHGGFNCEKLRT